MQLMQQIYETYETRFTNTLIEQVLFKRILTKEIYNCDLVSFLIMTVEYMLLKSIIRDRSIFGRVKLILRGWKETPLLKND